MYLLQFFQIHLPTQMLYRCSKSRIFVKIIILQAYIPSKCKEESIHLVEAQSMFRQHRDQLNLYTHNRREILLIYQKSSWSLQKHRWLWVISLNSFYNPIVRQRYTLYPLAIIKNKSLTSWQRRTIIPTNHWFVKKEKTIRNVDKEWWSIYS